MKTFRFTSAYKRDLKLIARRQYNIARLNSILNGLRCGEMLPPAARDHPLKGEWTGFRECHIEPDWLLIYKSSETEVLLTRTGTHADLFGT